MLIQQENVSSSTNDEQDAGALLLVLAVKNPWVLIGLGLYSLNKLEKEELVEGVLSKKNISYLLPTGPPPKEVSIAAILTSYLEQSVDLSQTRRLDSFRQFGRRCHHLVHL